MPFPAAQCVIKSCKRLPARLSIRVLEVFDQQLGRRVFSLGTNQCRDQSPVLHSQRLIGQQRRHRRAHANTGRIGIDTQHGFRGRDAQRLIAVCKRSIKLTYDALRPRADHEEARENLAAHPRRFVVKQVAKALQSLLLNARCDQNTIAAEKRLELRHCSRANAGIDVPGGSKQRPEGHFRITRRRLQQNRTGVDSDLRIAITHRPDDPRCRRGTKPHKLGSRVTAGRGDRVSQLTCQSPGVI